MTKQSGKHKANHQHAAPSAAHKSSPHKDWRLWVVVGLMLAAMLGYIMSMDEALAPAEMEDEQQMPADAA